MKTRTELAEEILNLWKVMYAESNKKPVADEYNTEMRDCGFAVGSDDGEIPDFYTEDLNFALDKINKGTPFSIRSSLIDYILAFLSEDRTENDRIFIRPKRDLLTQQFALYDKLFDITSSPRAKWPSKFSPSFMQEAAINLFVNRKTPLWPKTTVREDGGRDYSSIFSVNGPPGTGKTTLLKEIIASNTVQKAMLMAALESPDDMFTSSFVNSRTLYEWEESKEIFYKEDSITRSKTVTRMHYESGSVEFFCPSDSLVEHGITVASCNNKAVENISLELPVDGYIAELVKESWSFDFLSSYLKPYYESKEGEEKFDKIKDKIWALISLCMGNVNNMKSAAESVILPLVKGIDPHSISYKEERERFIRQYEKVEKIASEIKAASDAYRRYSKFEEECREEYGPFDGTLMTAVDNKIKILGKEMEEARRSASEHNSRYLSLRNNSGINWFSLLFASKKTKDKIDKIKEEKRLRDEKTARCTELKGEIGTYAAIKEKAKSLISGFESFRDKSNNTDGTESDNDMTYLSREYVYDLSSENLDRRCKAHTANPWMTKEYDREREKLFLYALEFSMKFCLASARFKHNILIYANLLIYDKPANYLDIYCLETGQVRSINTHKGPIWDVHRMKAEGIKTLQLLIPVVSTTFASIKNVYPLESKLTYGQEEKLKLAFNSIGTLIIDEAGQASPFCAVGAIMRSHSVMAVGDPLQIPPVVTNIETIREIPVSREQIKIKYLNPSASVQTFADEINPFGALQQMEDISSSIWLGCPLVVHRRCLDPMFSISNRISYAGSMINATPIPSVEDDTKAGYSIKETYWEDIKGKENTYDFFKHYVKEQGQFVIKKLTDALEERGNEEPGIFVISPFKTVINNLGRELERAGIEKELYDGLIGTVHTFQGKEADEVYILLGCDSTTKQGTFKFVSNNILNVAVSRAKKRLCIVGDRALWTGRNVYFKTASEEIDNFARNHH